MPVATAHNIATSCVRTETTSGREHTGTRCFLYISSTGRKLRTPRQPCPTSRVRFFAMFIARKDFLAPILAESQQQ